MNWSTITVGQFQDIYKLSLDKELDEFDKLEKVISIMFNITSKQIGELSYTDFNEYAKKCAFVMEQKIVPGKPVKSIIVGKRVYKIEYNPMKLRHRQYVEILHYGEKPIENMHFIMASLVQPIKWGFVRKNKAEDHSKISDDMLNAPLTHVYHAAVFFCKLYINLMKTLAPCLINEMMLTKKFSRTMAEEIMTNSLNAMAGFIPQNK